MTDLRLLGQPQPLVKTRGAGWLLRLAGSQRAHGILSRIPLVRNLVRAEGRALFDIVSGFVHSQVLLALVELNVLRLLQNGPSTAETLAPTCRLPPNKMHLLLQAGASLGLLKRKSGARFVLSARGAALLAVPGLESMIRHHPVLYRDLADPVAFLRGETTPELAQFWPYVFGANGPIAPELSKRYSDLMADSQGLVADDTLLLVDLAGVQSLLDVGGGSGAFLAAVAKKYPFVVLGLFELPAVIDAAKARLTGAGLVTPPTFYPGSFRVDALPRGADAISLVRVLFDHSDATVQQLLSAVFAALPAGGKVIISEPMSGGAVPDRATDSYFAFYTAAMQTGQTRSGSEIAEVLRNAGFTDIRILKGFRPFVTSVVTARRP